jgi:hypothetical protein
MAYVILSSKGHLGNMEAIPKKWYSTTRTDWRSGECCSSATKKRDIVDSLTKLWMSTWSYLALPLRYYVVYILYPLLQVLSVAGFGNFPKEEPKFVLLQNNIIRWNSTFHMLTRAKKLQKAVNKFGKHYNRVDFALSPEQWRQMIICSLLSGLFWKSVCIESRIYNDLWNILEMQLTHSSVRKVLCQKVILHSSIMAVEQTFSWLYCKDIDRTDPIFL